MNCIGYSELRRLADYKPLTFIALGLMLHVLKRFWVLFCLILISVGIFLILYTNLPQTYEHSISERILSREHHENSVEKSINKSQIIQNEQVEKIQIENGIESNIDIPQSKREDEELLPSKLIDPKEDSESKLKTSIHQNEQVSTTA